MPTDYFINRIFMIYEQVNYYFNKIIYFYSTYMSLKTIITIMVSKSLNKLLQSLNAM